MMLVQYGTSRTRRGTGNRLLESSTAAALRTAGSPPPAPVRILRITPLRRESPEWYGIDHSSHHDGQLYHADEQPQARNISAVHHQILSGICRTLQENLSQRTSSIRILRGCRCSPMSPSRWWNGPPLICLRCPPSRSRRASASSPS